MFGVLFILFHHAARCASQPRAPSKTTAACATGQNWSPETLGGSCLQHCQHFWRRRACCEMGRRMLTGEVSQQMLTAVHRSSVNPASKTKLRGGGHHEGRGVGCV
jgi:hypothetical protein